MDRQNQKTNPVAFIAIGVCFMGAGVTMGVALQSRNGAGIGLALIGVGVMFLLIGAGQMRKKRSGK